MTDYFAANDIAAYSVVSGTPTEVTSNIDTTYTPRGIQPGGGVLKSVPFMDPTTGTTTSLTDLWVHCDFFTGFFTGTCIEILNSSGVSVVRVTCTSNGVYRLDYWNGTSFVSGGSTFSVGAGVRFQCDLHLVAGASGSFTMYVNGNQQLQLTSLNAAVTNGQYVQFSGGSGQQTYSQVLVSDTNTIGAKVASLTPNSNSATNTAWTSDYTSIVKTGFNDATMISSSTLGDNETYGATDATLPTSQYFVSSVWVAIRARLNGSSPANIKPLLRMGGTNYAGAYNFGNLDAVTFKPSVAAFANDPSTSSAWSGVTNLNAAEVGVQTAA